MKTFISLIKIFGVVSAMAMPRGVPNDFKDLDLKSSASELDGKDSPTYLYEQLEEEDKQSTQVMITYKQAKNWSSPDNVGSVVKKDLSTKENKDKPVNVPEVTEDKPSSTSSSTTSTSVSSYKEPSTFTKWQGIFLCVLATLLIALLVFGISVFIVAVFQAYKVKTKIYNWFFDCSLAQLCRRNPPTIPTVVFQNQPESNEGRVEMNLDV